jgi:pyruvate/2-oxoglutarate dehydrogenase complex dihydrolipoamide acyltransferase (E2) component
MNTMFISKLNANDDSVRIIEWLVADKCYVEVGVDLVRVETSKVVIDLKSEFSGFVEQHCQVDDLVNIGERLASFYLSEAQCSLELAKSQIESPPALGQGTYFSLAAQQFIAANGIDANTFLDQGLLTLHQVAEKLLPKEKYVAQPGVSLMPLTRSEAISHRKKCEIKSLQEAQQRTLSSALTVEFDSDSSRQALKKIKWLHGQLAPYILHCFSKLLKCYPKLNAFYADNSVHYYDNVNLGLAVDIDHGLKVLVLPDADKLSLFDLNMHLMEKISRYYDDTLKPEDVTGSTVTVTDMSSFNILHFYPLLNKGQSAILGIGGDASRERHPMTLTLVFDHQILSGKEIALFLNQLKEKILDLDAINHVKSN